MSKLSIKTGPIKFIIGWLAVLLIRLIPFRPPNFEPMLSVIMPFSKGYKLISSFLFAFLGILIFDLLTSSLGLWTFITALTYGALAIVAFFFFKKRKTNILNYTAFAIIGTIIYDAITGLSIGPLFFGQSFMSALVGQIPFTAMHLAGSITFAVLLSPAIEKWVVSKKELEIKLNSNLKIAEN